MLLCVSVCGKLTNIAILDQWCICEYRSLQGIWLCHIINVTFMSAWMLFAYMVIRIWFRVRILEARSSNIRIFVSNGLDDKMEHVCINLNWSYSRRYCPILQSTVWHNHNHHLCCSVNATYDRNMRSFQQEIWPQHLRAQAAETEIQHNSYRISDMSKKVQCIFLTQHCNTDTDSILIYLIYISMYDCWGLQRSKYIICVLLHFEDALSMDVLLLSLLVTYLS